MLTTDKLDRNSESQTHGYVYGIDKAESLLQIQTEHAVFGEVPGMNLENVNEKE